MGYLAKITVPIITLKILFSLSMLLYLLNKDFENSISYSSKWYEGNEWPSINNIYIYLALQLKVQLQRPISLEILAKPLYILECSGTHYSHSLTDLLPRAGQVCFTAPAKYSLSGAMQPVFWEAVVTVVFEVKLANDSNDNCAKQSTMRMSKRWSLPSFHHSKFTKVFDTEFCFINVV